MKSNTFCLALLPSCLTLAQPLVNAESSSVPCPWSNTVYHSQEEIVNNWYALWDGDYSYLEKTVTPGVQLFQDRFPTGDGSVSLPIYDSTAMLQFVKTSREGFETYSFIDDFHYGVDNLITLRWTLNATWGGSDDTTLPAGSHVAYNGTDILIQEPCSGLIQEILSAQDLVTFYHVLGRSMGKV